MLTKIAFKSLRKKWRDYIVLFVGMAIAVAIFYMFSSMATNEAFLKGNSTMKMTVPVFIMGEVLLGIITFVYLNFANNFLLQLRQKEYGLFSMLGATKRQIGSLLLRETLLIGMVAVLVGIIAGIGLTQVSADALMSLMDVQLKNWQVITPKAIVTTVVFFFTVFFLNGVYNRFVLVKKDTLALLNADKTVSANQPPVWKQFLLGLIGLAILGSSYYLMSTDILGTMQLAGLGLVLVLNVTGTYLFVSQTLSLITTWVHQSEWELRGLRAFLNGQLRFRLGDYKRMLTMISVLFGMALGAMSVGQGYYATIEKQGTSFGSETMVVKDAEAIKQADLISRKNYDAIVTYVVADDKVYFDQQTIKRVPVLRMTDAPAGKNDFGTNQQKWTLVAPTDHEADYNLSSWANYATGKPYGTDFELVKTLPAGERQQMRVIHTTDPAGNKAQLNKMLATEQATLNDPEMMVGGAYPFMKAMKSLLGGLQFMSVFLGIAFLVMLASTLMFKTLTGAAQDQRRYQILGMVGVTRRQAQMTIAKDLAILFFIPMAIGLLDAGLGLKMFDVLMPNPYIGFTSALQVVLAIYLAYYLITVFLYQRLVLKTFK